MRYIVWVPSHKDSTSDKFYINALSELFHLGPRLQFGDSYKVTTQCCPSLIKIGCDSKSAEGNRLRYSLLLGLEESIIAFSSL